MFLRTKILFNSVMISVLAVAASSLLIGGLSYQKAKDALTNATHEKLNLLRDLKTDEIKRYYQTLNSQVNSFANNFTTVQALVDFNAAYSKYAREVEVVNVTYSRDKLNDFVRAYAQKYADLNGGKVVNASKLLNKSDPVSFALQYNYIIDNPNPLDSKDKLLSADDHSSYSKVHQHYHRLFAQYSKRFNVHDIMLVNNQGVIVYTVAKELDFTTSLNDGLYSKYEIGKIYNQVINSVEKNFSEVSDYIPYIPSYERQAAFICAPIWQNGVKIGALIFQLSIDDVNAIMTSDAQWQQIGLGNTGEAYLVGADKTLRSTSRLFVENKTQYLNYFENKLEPQLLSTIKARESLIGLQQINTLAVKQAFTGKAGIDEYSNYLDQIVIGSYQELDILGLNWAIVCEVNVAEAFASVSDLANFVILCSVVVVIFVSWVAAILAFGLAKYITKRVNVFAKVIETIANKGDFTIRLNEKTNDELKLIASSLNKLFTNLQISFQETLQSARKLQDSVLQQHKDYERAHLDSQANVDDSLDAQQELDQQKELDKQADLALDNNVSDNSLDELTAKLNKLSDQFKFFEEEADKTRDWQ